jgi:hypothetical protein
MHTTPKASLPRIDIAGHDVDVPFVQRNESACGVERGAARDQSCDAQVSREFLNDGWQICPC